MIRPYQFRDKPQILKIFQLNTPKYFAPEEQQDLEDYLDHELDGYFVYELEGKVVGAGGYNITPTDGRLSWYFIDPQHQGKGIGQALAHHALNLLKLERPTKIIVRTSQWAHHFFGKLGFVIQKIERDYWAVGLDLYEMELVCH